MRPTVFIAAAAGVAALPYLSGPTWAQANRTFVSGHGSDSNPCSLAAPCRSFAQALTQTNAGGEITILDPAGYGPVTITRSVSIVNDGVGESGVTATSGDAITVSTGASDVVNLRGLTLVGGGVADQGIQFNNLGTLNVQNCVIRGFINAGVALVPAGTAAFNIADTIVSNTANVAVGIQTLGAGTVTASFNRVQAIGSGNDGVFINGVNSTGTVNATIANSVVTNNGLKGIAATSSSGQAVTLVMVVNTVVANNAIGIVENGANSTIYLAKNTIAGNTTAFTVTNNGALFSFGDNYIKSNGSDGGAIPLVAAK